ncbi:hypothetical protein C1I98_33925 [Spongiactinospora gelatinilytica]|uniref:Uncharacterized protein n=1 Tax=Spongiactinospora gelatinilytica TaxID=2666298 RepID=A0A2W2EPU4_9ACTN|nr:hypothetical protein [Spongiactinospora gelatinilytica]PZG26476.1 hypothetical protein C1I98_33925 [Spongiactinospora gelatinilytica]
MIKDIGVGELRILLSTSLASAQDADTIVPSVSTLFTPDSHRLALDVDATVVKGGRGVGKTFWFRSLLDDRLRSVASHEYRIDRLTRVTAHAGYGADNAPERYPGSAELRSLVDSGALPWDLWNTVLLVALGVPDLRGIPAWKDRIRWVREHPAERDRTIAEADRRAANDGTLLLVLFDALEHLHRDRRQAEQLVVGILQLALELRLSTRHIRFKIFIRPDMFDGALLSFPDASKLTANAASLRWSPANLYGLLFQYLGNSGSAVAERFRALIPGWVEAPLGRHLPPPRLLGDEKQQAELFTAIAGPYMGANFRKGHTYTWLPNHLMDGTEQVSPRSFLSALVKAVEETTAQYAAHEYAIHHEGIRRGVQAASTTRVEEIKEDLPWVQVAIDPLAGQQVPIDESTVIDLWTDYGLTEALQQETTYGVGSEQVRTGPRYSEQYPKLVEELIELGVMRRRRDGRIDLPDVYRIAFSIGRKGGVPKVRS